MDALKKEVEELRQKNSDLESQVAMLQAEVCSSVCVVILCCDFVSSLQKLAKYTEESEVRY